MIDVIKVADKEEGQVKAHDLLKSFVDKETVLALSGGTTPNYRQMIVKPGDILPGAVCVVDERYGKAFHANSNELLIKESGLLNYLKKCGIGFHKVLRGKNFLQTAADYNQTVSELFEKFPKKIGIMGIGTNLHTAGIFPNSTVERSLNLVIADEVEDKYPQRITLTMRALAEFDSFIIMAFGEEKKKPLLKILDATENDMKRFPAIFYRKAPVRSFLITDQEL